MVNDTMPHLSESENVAAAVVVILSSVASITGNGLVMLSYFICSRLRSQPGSCFVVNLALSDFLCGVYVQIPCMFNLANPKLYFEGMFCVVHSVLTWCIMTTSNWTLVAISVDRAIAINRPFLHTNCVTAFRVRCVIAMIWICSLMLAASIIRKDSISYQSWELMCSPKWTKENAPQGYFAAVLCFWIPTTIMLGSNISIIYAVRHLKSVISPRSPEQPHETNPQFHFKDHTKTLRSLYVLVSVYFFLGSPYFLAKFSFITKERGVLPRSLVVLTILLMFSASALNPFIYAILRKDHREAFLKTINIIKDKLEKVPRIIFRKRKETNEQSQTKFYF